MTSHLLFFFRNALVLGVIAFAPAMNQNLADLNGEWVGALELEGGTHNLSFVFKSADSTFAGTVYDNDEFFGEMERGSFSGNTVKFSVDKLQFTGVINGRTMKVALIVYNGSTRNFTMTKKLDRKNGGGDAGRH